MHYAAHWKMQAGLMQLRETNVSVAELAGHLGYDSEAAFSRAFKRIIGISPGAARRSNDPLGNFKVAHLDYPIADGRQR